MQAAALDIRDYTFPNVIARRAGELGDKPYLLFEGERYSYADVHRLTNSLAGGLLAAGMRHGDHVALMLDNSPAMVWYYLALGKIGAVSVPLNTAARGELLGRNLRLADVTVIVTSAAYSSRVAAVISGCPKLKTAILVEDGKTEATVFATGIPGLALLDHAALMQSPARDTTGVPVDFKDLACLMFTSGTTGPSKAIMTVQATIFSPAAAIGKAFGYKQDDIMYTCLPLFHGNAMRSLYVALLAGATIALARRFSASGFWADVKHTGATQLNLMGAMANMLQARPPSGEDRDHAVTKCMIVPIPALGSQFAERFGVGLCSTYALTDYAYITFLTPGEPVEKWATAGRVQPDMEVAILDDDDMSVAQGEVGEICVRSRRAWTSAQGYYGMPDATVAAWRNLWFHTGDRGLLDEDGYLHFRDRKKDSIRRRGENISSHEVEQILAMHPEVREVAAYAVRSDMSEDEVMVSVVRTDGSILDEAALVRWAAGQMAYFMVPRYVQLLPALPRTLTEKVEKYKLKADAERDLHQLWDREAHGITVNRHSGE